MKGSDDSRHHLDCDEVNGLRLQQRQQARDGITSAYVFVNERAQPFGWMSIGRMIERAGEAAGLPSLPRPRQYHKHGALYGDVARALPRHLALILTGKFHQRSFLADRSASKCRGHESGAPRAFLVNVADMAIRLSHALHAVPARKIRKRAFIVIILAGIATIAMVLVMAPR